MNLYSRAEQNHRFPGFWKALVWCLLGASVSLAAQTSPSNDDLVSVEWVRQVGRSGFEQGAAARADAAGNAYFAGAFQGTLTLGSSVITSSGQLDVVLAKFDANGVPQWAVRAGGGGEDRPNNLAVDTNGNVYVTGFFTGAARFTGTDETSLILNTTSSVESDAFVAKYTSTGRLLWAVRAGGALNDAGFGIALDPTGFLYVSGFFMGSASFGDKTLTSQGGADIFVAKYDLDGHVLWARSAGGTGEDLASAVVADGAGNIYVTGYFMNSAFFGSWILTSLGGADVFLARFDASGAVLWARSAGGVLNDAGQSVAADSAGRVYVAGYYQGSASFQGENAPNPNTLKNGFLAQYDTGGNQNWIRTFGGPGDDEAVEVAVHPEGPIFVTGYFNQTATFGAQQLVSLGEADVFVARHNAAGQLLSVRQAGGPFDDSGRSITTGANGDTYFAGQFLLSINFSRPDGSVTSLNSLGGSELFIGRLGPEARLPRITVPPQSVVTNVGATVVFQVTATGAEPLSYQWQFNGINLADNAGVTGSKMAQLVISNVQPIHTGRYTVLVTNLVGSAISTPPAELSLLALPVLSIADAQLVEGNSGTNAMRFTVSLSVPLLVPVTVTYASADDTATAGSDYLPAAGVLEFSPGQTSQSVTVLIKGDVDPEPNETFWVRLSAPTNASLDRSVARGTILNDELVPSVSISDAAVIEGDVGTAVLKFTVSLSEPDAQTVTVDYTTRDDTAVSGVDFAAVQGTLEFQPGQTNQTLSVLINGNLLPDGDRTLWVILSNPTRAILSDAQGLGIIVDDDLPPFLMITDAASLEGDGGNRSLQFTVALSRPGAQAVTVQFLTQDLTAQAGLDYVATNGVLRFDPGQTNQTITVLTIGDGIREPNEFVRLILTNAVNAFIEDGEGLGTIIDDEIEPGLAIGSATVTEGNAGITNAVFTVHLAPASDLPVSVQFGSLDGSATGGEDYQPVSGVLLFNPGEVDKFITVPVYGDTLAEPNETFLVRLSQPTNAVIRTGQGVGTILDDDQVSKLSVSDLTVTEGNQDLTEAEFEVRLDPASTRVVTVNYATANGTAEAGNDYLAASGTLVFSPGQTRQFIHVSVLGDTLNEPDETFQIILNQATNAAIATASGTVTIRNDDSEPTLLIIPAVVAEENGRTNELVFRVRLSTNSGQPVTVQYSTRDGTALAGSDYVAQSGTLTFPIGSTLQAILVPIIPDGMHEPDETFHLDLANAVHAVLTPGQTTAEGLIQDDDPLPTISLTDAVVTEGAQGTTNAMFTVRLSSPSGETVTVHFATQDGTAVAGLDYVAQSGTLAFPPGTTVTNLAIPVLGDTLTELDETFGVTLSQATNAVLGLGDATGTILNDDFGATIFYGQVTDALNGRAMVGVSIQAGGATTVTDSEGYFGLTNLAPGALRADFDADRRAGLAPLTVQFFNLSLESASTVLAGKPGYEGYTNSHVQIWPGQTNRLDFSLSPTNVHGMRLVLNWAEFPQDLDAHLATPAIDGTNYLVFYAQGHRGDTNAPPYAQLDVDQRDGFGPETITINRFFPGEYHYYVHKFDEFLHTDELTNSSAVVQIYTAEGLVRTISVPALGEGDYWDVCTIDGNSGVLTLLNRIMAVPPVPLAPAVATLEKPFPVASAAGLTRPRLSYRWDFGDGTTSEDANPVKVYSSAGRFDVKLTVTALDQRNHSEFKSQFIQVDQELPALTVRRAGNQIQITWVNPPAGCVLESSAQLMPAEWKPVEQTPEVDGGTYTVTITAQGNQFFRLRKD